MRIRRLFPLTSMVVAMLAACGDDGSPQPPVVPPGTDPGAPPSSEGPDDQDGDGAGGEPDIGVDRGGTSGTGGDGFGGLGGTFGGFGGSFAGLGGTVGGTFGASRH